MMLLLQLLLLALLPAGQAPADIRKAETTPAVSPAERVVLVVSPQAQMHGVQRIGMNLGIWTSWGAEQLGANIIKNPGFEGTVDGSLASVKSADGTTLTLDGPSVHRPNGFWNGATVNFRTGLSAGHSATIEEFYRSTCGDASIRALLDSSLVAASGDIVALTKLDDAAAPTNWWLSGNQQNCAPGAPRPGSLGRRSLVLCSNGGKSAEANSYLDETTSRSGKMLPVRGQWRFSFWVRTVQGVPQLRVSFTRTGSKPFFAQGVNATNTWGEVVTDFDATDNGPAGPLQLKFSSTGPGEIAIDDVSLSRSDDGRFPFRHEVVAALDVLRPGYLRDWQGQLGDTIGNRLAPPFARRPTRYRSEQPEDAKFEYSIPEFLELCHRVGANPWLVLPTTASDNEYAVLGSYLAGREKQLHFGEILIEFGNENWNPLFGAAGIQDVKRHGEAATRAFFYVRKGAGPKVPLITVANAQFANQSQVAALFRERISDVVAVAPYFAYDLASETDATHSDAALFATARDSFAQLQNAAAKNREEIAFYEVNLHTTGGNARLDERDHFVLSSEAGSALAMRLIDGLSQGIRRQCVYTLSGFDAYTADHKELVELWGVVRDLAGPPQLRATGLAVSMLNQSIQKEMHHVALPSSGHSVGLSADTPSDLSAIAFLGKQGWSAAIVSARAARAEVTLSFPSATHETLPGVTLTLTHDPRQALQDASVVYGHARVISDGGRRTAFFSVPPHSFVVLVPEALASRGLIGATR